MLGGGFSRFDVKRPISHHGRYSFPKEAIMREVLSKFFFLAAISGSPRVCALSTAAIEKFTELTKGPLLSQQSMGWCQTASIHPLSGEIILESFNEEESIIAALPLSSASVSNAPTGRFLDLRQAADWMEYLEQKEGRQHDDGGAGAYDTMRCDIIVPGTQKITNSDTNTRPKIWGQGFHLERLKNSYLSLVKSSKLQMPSKKNFSSRSISQKVLSNAISQSEEIISSLLSEAEASMITKETVARKKEVGVPQIQLIRVTLLWSRNRDDFINENPEEFDSAALRIIVRGHATSSCTPVQVTPYPKPIIVSVAAHSRGNDMLLAADKQSQQEPGVDKTLPTRFANPHSKIASWCRQRKEMERPDTYKPPGVSEVLMVRPRLDEESKSRLEILEGLSSNFFVIYKNGTLRTATEGVLDGYVRHLVLKHAKKIGLRFDPRPVFLHEASEWKEAFITSSSRLIWPISKVLLPEDGPQAKSVPHHPSIFSEHWRQEDQNSGVAPSWQLLLTAILRDFGYTNL